MALTVTRVGYRNFRNMSERVLEPAPGLTILVGPNAVGKTNCIEGLQVLTSGSSFKHASPGELLLQGAERGCIEMRVEGEKRLVDVVYDIHPTRKILKVNGKRRSASQEGVVLASVLFYPDELMLIKGGASGRRDLLDDLGSQLNHSYAQVGHDFRRAIYQRNSLYKQACAANARPDRGLLDAWTLSAARAGAMLFLYRTALLSRLSPHVVRIYAELSGGEGSSLSYESDYGRDFDVSTPRAVVEDMLFKRMRDLEPQEERRCSTLVGPHLDDVHLEIDGKPARTFASQGQQRSLVLALKLAQVELVREMQGEYPVFLLDDVMSELDARRRSRLFGLINAGVQTIVTTTNLDYFSPEELRDAKVVGLG